MWKFVEIVNQILADIGFGTERRYFMQPEDFLIDML